MILAIEKTLSKSDIVQVFYVFSWKKKLFEKIISCYFVIVLAKHSEFEMSQNKFSQAKSM
jgi:hypothetical protein